MGAHPALAASGTATKIMAPAGGIYHGAFADFAGTEDRVTAARISSFAALAGKPIAWSYFSQNWMDGITFPAANVAVAHNAGTVPFIRMMPRSTWKEGGPDPAFTMQAILAGTFDAQFAQWARDAKAVGYPLMVEFGTEVNGDWFPWNGRYNGGTTAGPAAFRDAYRHIIDLFRAQGVTNVTWVFHVDAQPSPDRAWNAMANYYPGDSYIDWLGISVYGPQSPSEDWQEFQPVMDAGYAALSALSPSKPIALLEFAVTDGFPGHSKADWITKAFASITSGRYPRLKAVSWWHENFSNSDGTKSMLRMDSSQAALDAYRAAVANPLFTTAIVTGEVPLPATTPAATTTPSPPSATPTPTATPPAPCTATAPPNKVLPIATQSATPTPTSDAAMPASSAAASPTVAFATPTRSAVRGFKETFEAFATGTAWMNGATFGRWIAESNGGGLVSTAGDGSRVLSLSPLRPASVNDSRTALVRTAASFKDVDVTVRMKTTAQLRTPANPWESGWLLWSYADAQHFYYVTLKPNGIEVGKQDPSYAGGRRYLVTSSAKTFPVGRWYTVRVKQSAGTITVWVDGVVQATFTDRERPYPAGSIALLAADATVIVDDIVVK